MVNALKKMMLHLSEYVEIILAIYLLVVICLVIGRTVFTETPLIFTEGASLHHFLEASLTIAVSIEFLKMLCMHTPGTLIEVLLFAIARHMIVAAPAPEPADRLLHCGPFRSPQIPADFLRSEGHERAYPWRARYHRGAYAL